MPLTLPVIINQMFGREVCFFFLSGFIHTDFLSMGRIHFETVSFGATKVFIVESSEYDKSRINNSGAMCEPFAGDGPSEFSLVPD